MACGRVRKELGAGWTPLVDGQLEDLRVGVLTLARGQSHSFETGENECAVVLVRGRCTISTADRQDFVAGPRPDPFEHKPSGALVSRGETVRVAAQEDSLVAVASAPARQKTANTYLTSEDVRQVERGQGVWSRSVRFVFWPDNSDGNMLLAGETVTPPGHWSTMPPHRHDVYTEGEEMSYEEAYFLQFSKPQGFGLIWQFDDDGQMDQAFSLRNGDAAYMGRGYHPVSCSPVAALYHLTFMAGPHRLSQARLHPDYSFLVEEQGIANPYKNQK
jgi:5-deoxy-glucuronate isomerase